MVTSGVYKYQQQSQNWRPLRPWFASMMDPPAAARWQQFFTSPHKMTKIWTTSWYDIEGEHSPVFWRTLMIVQIAEIVFNRMKPETIFFSYFFSTTYMCHEKSCGTPPLNNSHDWGWWWILDGKHGNMAGLPHDIANFHDYPFYLINNPSKVPIHGHYIAIKSIIQIYLSEVP